MNARAVALLVTFACLTPLGLGGGAVARAAPAGAFTAGAAVESYTPYCGPDGTPTANHCQQPPASFTDPANCATAAQLGVYTGRRLFAFEEPYIDQQHDGHYDAGDPFLDCNQDGRWDGNFLGGGANAPRYYDNVADPVSARAIVVANGTRTIALEVLDHEGAFNVYLQAIRGLVAQRLPSGATLNANNIFISSTHDESAPDSIGLYGVNPATSSVNPYWVAYMEQQAALAITRAYAAMQPVTISYGADISLNDLVASVKASVSHSATRSVTTTVGHTYTHPVPANKFGNLKYGAWGYYIDGCTSARLDCPSYAHSCAVTGTSYIDLANHRGDRVTMNSRIWMYNSAGQVRGWADMSCAGYNTCSNTQYATVNPGESITVQCNGVRANTGYYNTGIDNCKGDLRSQ